MQYRKECICKSAMDGAATAAVAHTDGETSFDALERRKKNSSRFARRIAYASETFLAREGLLIAFSKGSMSMSKLDIGALGVLRLTIRAAHSLSHPSRSIRNRKRDSFVSGMFHVEDSTQNVGSSFDVSHVEPSKQTDAPLV